MGYTVPKPNQNIDFINYISENLEKSISYTDYVAQNIDNMVLYTDYIAEHLKNSPKLFTYDLVSEPSFRIEPEKKIVIEEKNTDESFKLNWWCEKNKTSDDFWKYKL